MSTCATPEFAIVRCLKSGEKDLSGRTNLTLRRYRARIRCENISSSIVNGITEVRYEMRSVVGSDLNSFVFRTTLFK
jgi:hypothetical protein